MCSIHQRLLQPGELIILAAKRLSGRASFFAVQKFLGSQESLVFGLHRAGRVLLGDEMGLGKTLQARARGDPPAGWFLLGKNSGHILSG